MANSVKSQTRQLLGRSSASLFVWILSSSSLQSTLRNWVRVQRHLSILSSSFGDWDGRMRACLARRCICRVPMPKQIFECCLFLCGVHDSRLSALILLVHTIVWVLAVLVVCSVSPLLHAPRNRGAAKVNRRAPMVAVALWLIWAGLQHMSLCVHSMLERTLAGL